MIKIVLNNQQVIINTNLRLVDIIKQNKKVIACKVNGCVKNLNYIISQPCKIDFITLKDEEGMRIYESSLRFLFAYACYLYDPTLDMKFSFHISKSIYIRPTNKRKLNLKDIIEIQKIMKNLIAKNLVFKKEAITKEEAYQIYKKQKNLDKLELLKYREHEKVNIYKLGDYYNYMYSYLVYSTKYLKNYKLRIYESGVLLSYPRYERKGKIPKFKNDINYAIILDKARLWSKQNNLNTVSKINLEIFKDEKRVINVCEQRHIDDIDKIVDQISKREKVKLIAIAGPSSSGKTTFSNRLITKLNEKNINPQMISIDDYYFDNESLKPLKNGKYDFEDIKALDLKLFNKNLKLLSEGKEIESPIFNFKKGERDGSIKIKGDINHPILIEGIHALNPKLSKYIKKENKYMIYISPHLQINLDNHNPISITNLRLVRRMVRDSLHRGNSPKETLSMWELVRRGEIKWIYKYQQEADFIFNSELSYELCVLKNPAINLLLKIEENTDTFIIAKRLFKFLKYFNPIGEENIPQDSISKEFIKRG